MIKNNNDNSIKLKRAKLINWYSFWDDDISFDDMTLICGANKSGKSTVLDAISYAYIGLRAFNEAGSKQIGTNERTIPSYTRGLITKDKWIRPIKDWPIVYSYIVLEFDNSETQESFIQGVVIETKSDNSMNSFWFSISQCRIQQLTFFEKRDDGQAALSPTSFKKINHIKENDWFFSMRSAMEKFFFKQGLPLTANEIAKLRQHLKGMKAYSTNLGVDEFIRDNLLMEHPVDFKELREKQIMIDEIMQKYKIINERVGKLEEMQHFADGYEQEYKKLSVNQIKRCIQQRDENQQHLAHNQKKIRDNKALIFRVQQRVNNIAEEIRKKQETKEEAEKILLKSDKGQAIKNEERNVQRLKDQMSKLEQDVEQLNALYEESQHLINFLQDARVLPPDLKNISDIFISNDSAEQREVQFAHMQEFLRDCRANAKNREIDLNNEKDAISRKLAEAVSKVNNAKKAQINYYQGNTDLKKFVEDINKALEDNGIHDKAAIVSAYVVGFTDPSWQDAIESKMGRHRFAVLTPPQGYDIADAIQLSNRRYGAFELINSKLLASDKEERFDVFDDSVYHFLNINNPLASRYFISYLGHIHAVDSKDVSNHHNALSKERRTSQHYNIFTFDRPKIYCLGKEAAKHNLKLARKEQQDLSDKKRQNEEAYAQCNAIVKVISNWMDTIDMGEPHFRAVTDLRRVQKEYQQESQTLKQLQQEAKGNVEFISLIQKTTQLKKDIANSRKEQDTITEQISECRQNNQILEKDNQKLIAEINNIQEQLEEMQSKQQGEYLQAEQEYKNFKDNIHPKINSVKSEKWDDERRGKMSDNLAYLISVIQEYNKKVEIDKMLHSNPRADMTAFQMECNHYLQKLKVEDLQNVKKDFQEQKSEFMKMFKSDICESILGYCENARKEIRKMSKQISNIPFGETTYSFKSEYTTDPELRTLIEYAKFSVSHKDLQEDNSQQNFLNTVDDNERARGEELNQKATRIINRIIKAEDNDKEMQKFSDYRQYLSYSLTMDNEKGTGIDFRDQQGYESGGGNQVPYILILLASMSLILESSQPCAKIFFMDEPFVNLDSYHISTMIQCFKQMGFQVIFASASAIESIGQHCNILLEVDRDLSSDIRRTYFGILRFDDLAELENDLV